jgi:two-component system response regulator AtoC
MADTLLLIEDEKLLGTELARHFRSGGWHVVLAETLAEARRSLIEDELSPLIVLSDMSLPDGTALDLLEEVRKEVSPASAGEWLFLTGYGTVADSVRALRLGAVDFLEKPCSTERLDLVISSAARGARAQRRLEEQSNQLVEAFSVEAFVGRSQAAHNARALLRKLTEVDFSALVIGGETGTGKGLATRILHHCGQRSHGPLIEVNCAALPRELLESELFGHEAGAFTGAKKRRRGLVEQATGGTLFLDEISEMDLDLQSKLLKMIEDQRIRPLGGEREIEVDVQIVAASNRNLKERADEGSFRGDLYHRLSVFDLTLPPLRSRPEDLRDLVPRIVEEYNAKSGKRISVIPEEVWRALESYRWPGNVRELRNVIERSVLLSDSDTFPMEWLQLPDHQGENHQPTVEGNYIILPLDGSLSLEDMDRYIVSTALERADHNMSAAARTLGTTRQTLRYRAQKYGLTDSKS